jgi:hypothetical protein
MAPKGGNMKKESGRAKKAENEIKKKEAASADQERKEAAKWAEGSKADKAAEARAKQEAAAAKKAEIARLLAEEEAQAGSSKVTDPIVRTTRTNLVYIEAEGPQSQACKEANPSFYSRTINREG